MAQFAIEHAKKAGVDGTVVNGSLNKVYSTRFANSAIHQNFTSYTTSLAINVIKGKKNVGVNVNSLDKTEVTKMVDHAAKVVGMLPDDPAFPGVLKEPQEYKKLQLNDPLVRNLEADDVADKIISGINASHEHSKLVQTVSGNLNLTDGVAIFLSSEGMEAITPETAMTSTVNVMSENDKGESRSNSDFGHRIFKDLPIVNESLAAAERSVNGLNAVAVEPGKYKAVLDFQAAATPAVFTGMALSAQMVLDHASYLRDRVGEQVLSEQMTMVNDPHDPTSLSAAPLDSEGVASQQYTLINNGVLENYAHSRLTASKMGTQSNGCGFSMYGRSMSFPFAMKVQPGTRSKDDLIAELEDGLLITNFHYANFVDPTRGTLTGMTKDGLFIVKNGEIVGAAKNMRFTDGVLSMLKNAELSKETFQATPFGLGISVPAMKIDEISFSSGTSH